MKNSSSSPKSKGNLWLKMCWSIVSNAAERLSSDRTDTWPSQMPVKGHLPNAIGLFPYYDASGRLTKMAQGGCGSQGGSSVEWEQQEAQEHLTKTANWRLENNVSEVQGLSVKLGFFNNGFARACLKHCGTRPEVKAVLMISVTTGMSMSKQTKKERVRGLGQDPCFASSGHLVLLNLVFRTLCPTCSQKHVQHWTIYICIHLINYCNCC